MVCLSVFVGRVCIVIALRVPAGQGRTGGPLGQGGRSFAVYGLSHLPPHDRQRLGEGRVHRKYQVQPHGHRRNAEGVINIGVEDSVVNVMKKDVLVQHMVNRHMEEARKTKGELQAE